MVPVFRHFYFTKGDFLIQYDSGIKNSCPVDLWKTVTKKAFGDLVTKENIAYLVESAI